MDEDIKGAIQLNISLLEMLDGYKKICSILLMKEKNQITENQALEEITIACEEAIERMKFYTKYTENTNGTAN